MPAFNELPIKEVDVPVPTTLSADELAHQAGVYRDYPVSTNQKGDIVENGIYQFLRSTVREVQGKKVYVHYTITTTLFKDEKEEKSYFKSLETNFIEGNVLAIKPGTMRLRLMEERVVKQGMHFRAVAFSSKSINDIPDVDLKADKQTVFWATEEKTTFLSILPNLGQPYFDESMVLNGDEHFGFGLLGIEADYAPKLMKRNQEIMRATDKNLYFGNSYDVSVVPMEKLATMPRTWGHDRLIIAKFTNPQEKVDLYGEKGATMLYDGGNVVDAELVLAALKDQPITPATERSLNRQINDLTFAIDHGEEPVVGRYIFRVVAEEAEIKGDCVAVIGLKERTGADVVAHEENFKGEFRTNGKWTIVCFDNHDPVHNSNWDNQSETNQNNGLTMDQKLADLRRLRLWADGVIADPEPPEWITNAQDFHSEDADHEELGIGKLGAEDFVRWGRDTRESQNFPALWLNIADKKMRRAHNKETGWYDKAFLPQSNAVSIGIFSYSILEDMALIDLSHMDHSICNYMTNVGMLWSDERHIATFDLAGTKDFDDTSTAHDRLVYCSDPAYLRLLIADGVIEDCVLPTTVEEAEEGWALIIRQPNGAGEYSIERVSRNFPFKHFMEADKKTAIPVPTLDLAKMPRGVTHLVTELDVIGLGSDPEREAFMGQSFSGAEGRAIAHYILEAQAINPGIGQVVNALLLWKMTMGSTLPISMFDVLGEMVDAVQQGHDKVAIGNVALQPEEILAELAAAIRANPNLKVDTSFVANRFAGVKSKDMTTIRKACKAGRLSTFSKKYGEVHTYIRETVKKRIMGMRASTNLCKAVQDQRFSAKHLAEAKATFENLSGMMGDYDAYYQAQIRKMGFRPPTFAVMSVRQAKSHAFKGLVENAVGQLTTDPVTGFGPADPRIIDRKVIAMYRYAVTPQGNMMGRYDRCIFQSGGAYVAIFDLLRDAIDRRAAILGL